MRVRCVVWFWHKWILLQTFCLIWLMVTSLGAVQRCNGCYADGENAPEVHRYVGRVTRLFQWRHEFVWLTVLTAAQPLVHATSCGTWVTNNSEAWWHGRHLVAIDTCGRQELWSCIWNKRNKYKVLLHRYRSNTRYAKILWNYSYRVIKTVMFFLPQLNWYSFVSCLTTFLLGNPSFFVYALHWSA